MLIVILCFLTEEAHITDRPSVDVSLTAHTPQGGIYYFHADVLHIIPPQTPYSQCWDKAGAESHTAVAPNQ